MQAVESVIEALSDKNTTVKLRFDHVKLEWPIPMTSQTGSVQLTGEIVMTVTTENLKEEGKEKGSAV
jgi:hypothetical protein